MADLASYTTPDGRQVQLPPAFASNFIGLTPVTPMPAAGALPTLPPPMAIPSAPIQPGGETAGTPDNATPLAAATPPPAPPINGPVTSPDQLPPPTGQPSVPRGPVLSPAEDTGTSSLAKPPPVPGGPGSGPLTEAQLGKLGNAGSYNAQSAAIDEQKTAARKVGEAAADQATAVGNAMATAAEEERRILEQRQQVAEKNARDLEAKTNEYLTNAKAIADTRIDRNVDHPVWTAIGLALSTLGSALKGQSNEAAIKGVYDALDRKVAGQMQDLELKQKGLAVQREGLDFQRQAGKDRLEQLDTYRLSAILQAQRKIEAIKMQTSVPGVRAAADQVLAGLDDRKAQVLGGAQERWQQQRNAEANRAQAAQMHRDTMTLQWAQLDEQRQARAAALAEKLIDRKGAEGAAQAKLIQEQAIVDPSTGDFMLTPAGQQKLQQADTYEAQARKATDPAQAQKLNGAAQQLRESAQTNDIAIALNKKGAEDAQGTIKTAQDLTNRILVARQMLQAGPQAWDREKWAELTTYLDGIKRDYAQSGKERLSPLALNSMGDVLSIDPSSLTSRTVDVGKAIGALNVLEKTAAQSADVALRNAGIKSGWTPAKPTIGPSFNGLTAQELADKAGPAAPGLTTLAPDLQTELAEAARDIPAIRSGDQSAQDRALEAANERRNAAGQQSVYGLAPEVDDQVRALIKRAGSVGHAEYGRITSDLASPLASDRPGLAIGIAGLLRDEDPKLLNDVLSRVAASAGKMKADEIRDAITMKASSGPQARDLTPPVLRTMSPADRAKWLEWARSNGFAGAVPGGR